MQKTRHNLMLTAPQNNFLLSIRMKAASTHAQLPIVRVVSHRKIEKHNPAVKSVV
jgi:hypothetical protein